MKLVSLLGGALLACLCANSLAGQEAASANLEVLTLERAVAQALENNRSIKISSQMVFQANAQIQAVRTQLSLAARMLSGTNAFRISDHQPQSALTREQNATMLHALRQTK